ncbi:MAG: MBL fold metallo-hydrolase, partial [Pseudomonadota bacterium]
MMKIDKSWSLPALLAVCMSVGFAQPAMAEPCLDVTLTGTQGGPPAFSGLAGAGTLVRYGDSENNCSDVVLQFDAGRGTVQSLSEIPMPVGRIDAVFLTHIHSDHVEGLPGVMQLRWHFNSGGPQVDLVCSADAPAFNNHV